MLFCEVFSCMMGCVVVVCVNVGVVVRRVVLLSVSNRCFIVIFRLGGKEGCVVYCDGVMYGVVSVFDGLLNWNVGDIGSVVVFMFVVVWLM